ncbi:hypothetical protein SAMN05720606_12945 [Paenibacillus polysaccharolyticus]|uniref:Uncharacterized protein n=1 Tax=Paenibacillus polysaccharolyticus TaxID=582692 RepID=A0A1G5LMW9_9BACL|nr:hypothetical protein SAMN05720606_12945 [Paenibacillus polysaccharolyticus]
MIGLILNVPALPRYEALCHDAKLWVISETSERHKMR